ncbi:MAG: hypothetical protein ACP5G0_04465 [Desulfomonilia bacterium]
MEYTKRSLLRNPSDKCGWVLIYALIFIVIIQATVMASTSILVHHMKTTNAFSSILKATHQPSVGQSIPTLTQSVLEAPEGWDHRVFSTEVRLTTWGKRQSASWRVTLREQPAIVTNDALLSHARTSIILLIDDCTTMNSASWMEYDPQGTYLLRPTGEIIRVWSVEDIQTVHSIPSGTCFPGSHGNASFRAPPADGLTGAMPRWTWVYSCAKSLLDELDACDVAVATVSCGIKGGFTRKRDDMLNALNDIHPSEADCRLAESLYALTGAFPGDCAEEKHIILLTDGISLNDGHLPPWLQDFDHDGDVLDTHIPGAGSRCLDDVSAYASSIGIHVHTIGPDTAFLRAVALKGSGSFMPTRENLVPDEAFVTQMRTPPAQGSLTLLNRHSRFDPPWVIHTIFPCYRLDEITPPHLCPEPPLAVQGPVSAVSMYNSSLMCSTLQDCLFRIDVPTLTIPWMIRGVGGKTIVRHETIIAGPNSSGMISCIRDGPEITWMKRGDLVDASLSCVYVADQGSITSMTLPTGAFLCEFSTTHTITSLLYDPCWGKILAGTHSGLIYVLDQDLNLEQILVTSLGGPIFDMCTFTWRKRPTIIALSESALCCCTCEGMHWSVPIENGLNFSTIAMDGKLYVSLWEEDAPCGGIDTGRTWMKVLDAVTGEILASQDISPGRSFGPLIVLEESLLEYISWEGHIHTEDISSLKGITWQGIGTRLCGVSE